MMSNIFKKELNNGNYELNSEGLYLPKSKVQMGGTFIHTVNGKDEQRDSNLVVNEGLDYILGSALANATQLATWYVGIFKANHTPIAGDVASTFAGAGVADEANAEYTEANRPTYNTSAGVTSQTLTNTANPTEFTANTAVTIFGAFLISENTKGGLVGTLCANSLFASSRPLQNADVLRVVYEFQVQDV